MKLKISLKKVALLGTICVFIAFCNTGSTREASASTTDSENSSTAADNALSEEHSNLYPIHVVIEGNDSYGFIDETGAVIIEPTYSWARNFSEGLAIVNKDDNFLVIDTKETVILKTSNYLNDFHNGMASFTDNTTYKNGYINAKGKTVLNATYDFAGDFDKNHTAIVSKGGKFYRINSKGKVLKTFSLDNKNNYYYNVTDDGYVIYSDTKTFLKGVMDLNGKIILKPKYSEVIYLGNGLFGVKKKLADEEGYQVGIKPSALFDKNGKQLTSYKLYDLSVYSNNYASITDNKYTYLIDTKGNKIASFPKQEGRGTLTVLDHVVQAEIDNTLSYLKMDGTLIWQALVATTLSSGVIVHSVKVKPNKYVVIYYPKLDGLSDSGIQEKINHQLESLFTSNRMKLTVKDELMVDDNFSAEQIKDLLIICKTGYDYPIGAAHGAPIRLYYFIDTKTGAFYQFKDLFKKDSSYIKILDSLVRKEMKVQEKKDGSTYDTLGSSFVTENQFFYLSKNNLTVYFDSGAITAYAAGFPQFEIPFSKISDLIDKDGAFWKSFQE